jgi:hypothetical protein
MTLSAVARIFLRLLVQLLSHNLPVPFTFGFCQPRWFCKPLQGIDNSEQQLAREKLLLFPSLLGSKDQDHQVFRYVGYEVLLFLLSAEQRDPKELTHSNGGRGEPIAPAGINVWNPSFDVTPADLITGIITEKVSGAAGFIKYMKTSLSMLTSRDILVCFVCRSKACSAPVLVRSVSLAG